MKQKTKMIIVKIYLESLSLLDTYFYWGRVGTMAHAVTVWVEVCAQQWDVYILYILGW